MTCGGVDEYISYKFGQDPYLETASEPEREPKRVVKRPCKTGFLEAILRPPAFLQALSACTVSCARCESDEEPLHPEKKSRVDFSVCETCIPVLRSPNARVPSCF